MAETSLCIPVFNSATFLGELFACLRVLAPPPTEIVFLDDASSDDSIRRLREFEAVSGIAVPVRVLSNASNSGIAAAYNRLVREARGEWVQLLDADDRLVETDYFERVAHALSPENDIVVTGLTSNARFLALASNLLGAFVPLHPPLWWPLLGSFATRAGVLYRRRLLIERPFPDPAWSGSDVIHLLDLRREKRCMFLNRPRVCYRVHQGAQSSQRRDYAMYRAQLARYGRVVRWAYAADLALRQAGQRWMR